MTEVDNLVDKNERRGTVEAEHRGLMATREQQYTEDKVELEKDFHRDMRLLRANREAALVAAGLNPDGSDPQGRPQGLAE